MHWCRAVRVVPTCGGAGIRRRRHHCKVCTAHIRPSSGQGLVPGILSTTVFAAEVRPTCRTPKVSPVAESVGIGLPVAVPIK